MASIILLDTVTAITVDTTKDISSVGGAYGNVVFFADVTTASGAASTWDVVLSWVSIDGNAVEIASPVADINGENVGMTELIKVGAFSGVSDAVPMPNRIFYDEKTGTDSLTMKIYAIVANG